MEKFFPVNDQKVDHQSLIISAVIEHYRQQLSLDGIGPILIGRGDGLNKKFVRSICRDYNVSRGIYGPTLEEKRESKDPHGVWIAEEITKLSMNWPNTLLERAQKCADLARKAFDEGHTKGRQASAITKLIWFLKPNEWTMFDNLAATGLGISKSIKPDERTKKYGGSVRRMLAFYNELQRREFVAATKEINEILIQSEFRTLYGERIIDKYLMLVGAKSKDSTSDWANDIVEECKIFVSLIPEKEGCQLLIVAQKIAEKCFQEK